MKKIAILVLSALVILTMSNCNGLKKMLKNADDINYKVNPEMLEMHNGKVSVDISGKFPEKYFNKKVTATITPVLVYENGEKALTPVYVEGEKIKGNAKVINYKPGGAFSYKETFEYQPEMRKSVLELRVTAARKSKSVDFPAEKIANGIIATPELVEKVGKTSPAKDKFVKDIPDSKTSVINYDKNSWALKNNELRKDDFTTFKDYVKNASEDELIQLISLEVSSAASPEGAEDFNQKVSDGRSTTGNNTIKNEFKKIDEFKNNDFYKSSTIIEDWDGFKNLVSESNLADKDMILRVIAMNSDPVRREQEIRNMSKTFEELEKEILPKLRRSEYKLNVLLIGHTDEEIESIYSTNPSALTVEELLYLGAKTTELDQKNQIYKTTSEIYPKDWRGFNNNGVTLYQKGNYSEAKLAIEKAKSIETNATILNNLANIYLVEGKIEEAETTYKSATGVSEASEGLGAISIIKGDYKNAIDLFGNNCSQNAGLAKILNNDYDGALKSIDCSPDKEEALSYYLKAIIGARKNDENTALSNLKTACSKDANLKVRASQDMEFFKYVEKSEFKAIIK